MTDFGNECCAKKTALAGGDEKRETMLFFLIATAQGIDAENFAILLDEGFAANRTFLLGRGIGRDEFAARKVVARIEFVVFVLAFGRHPFDEDAFFTFRAGDAGTEGGNRGFAFDVGWFDIFAGREVSARFEGAEFSLPMNHR
jgi:hypothetical protein